MRVLFAVQPGTLLRFALLVPTLAERGHEIHIAFVAGGNWRDSSRRAAEPALPERTVALVEDLQARFPGVTHGPAPRRPDSDGWGDVAWMVRGIADLAHNADPRYAGAGGLRRRTRQRILGRLKRPGELEPLGRRLALRVGRRLSRRTDRRLARRALGVTRRLEQAIPTSPVVDRFLRELAPDVVLVTGIFRHASDEVELLKSARQLGIPGGVLVAGWDNLTNKGSLKFTPERVFVWNQAQAEDAVELHGVPRDCVRATGAHAFDEWFGRRPRRPRGNFLAQLELDPAEPYVLYLCSSGNIVRDGEADFVRRWIEALRSSGNKRLRRLNVVVRPHPNVRSGGAEPAFDDAVVWPPRGVHPVGRDARDDFFDTIAHSAAVVGINTTAMIEATILDKSVLSILVEDFAQLTTLHFPYLLAENGGFLHVAADLDEHVTQLAGVLDEDSAGAERRRRFVESFVRPGGIDRPAAEIAVEGIEELAGVRVRGGTPLGARLLRLPLAVEAALSAAHSALRGKCEAPR